MANKQIPVKIEVDALGVITISRGCFERCAKTLVRELATPVETLAIIR